VIVFGKSARPMLVVCGAFHLLGFPAVLSETYIAIADVNDGSVVWPVYTSLEIVHGMVCGDLEKFRSVSAKCDYDIRYARRKHDNVTNLLSLSNALCKLQHHSCIFDVSEDCLHLAQN
jgi:hypothetical protein